MLTKEIRHFCRILPSSKWCSIELAPNRMLAGNKHANEGTFAYRKNLRKEGHDTDNVVAYHLQEIAPEVSRPFSSKGQRSNAGAESCWNDKSSHLRSDSGGVQV